MNPDADAVETAEVSPGETPSTSIWRSYYELTKPGIAGFVTKSAAAFELKAALTAVLAGGTYLPHLFHATAAGASATTRPFR